MRSLLQNRSLLSLVFLFSLMSHVSLISSSPMPMGQHQCLNDQRSTLVQLREDILNYSSPPRDSFPENSSMKVKGWDLERDCCSWEGVTCDTAGHVIGLDLSYSMLSGNISFVFYLSHLQHLNLSGNNFQLTPIPSGFGRLGNLTHLNLSSSCFSYQIPLEISSLTRLISLDLSNSISIPYCVSLPHNDILTWIRNLEPYRLSHDILTWIRNFELHRLRLEQPNLKTFVKNLSALTEVYLDNVDLSAQGSDWAVALSYALPNIEVLSLSDCGLSGSMHPSLSRLHFLSILNLDNNPLSSVAPNFLANFSNLVALSLGSCDLYGIFHDDVFLLPKLRTIDLSDNSLLTGQLPEFSSNNSLQVLSLEGTNFYGKLPDSIGNLKVLTNLLLGGCNFSGLIPSSLLNLTRIVELDLADNRFSGSIPPFHGNGLVYLDLSSNLCA